VVSEAGEVCCVDAGTVSIGCGGLLMGSGCTPETTKAWQRLVWCRFLHSLQDYARVPLIKTHGRDPVCCLKLYEINSLQLNCGI